MYLNLGMGKVVKKLIIIIAIQLLIITLFPVLVAAESTSAVICDLSTISPVGNIAYNGTMPLNVNMAWRENYSVVPFMYFDISYSIDDIQKILIPQGNNPQFNSTAQGTAYHYEYVVFPPSTTNTAIDIDISSLSSGAHKLTIFSDGEFNSNNDFIFPYHYRSPPIYFSVNYLATYPTASPSPTTQPSLSPIESPTPTQSPTATPTVPELSWLVIVPLLLSILLVAAMVRRRRCYLHSHCCDRLHVGSIYYVTPFLPFFRPN